MHYLPFFIILLPSLTAFFLLFLSHHFMRSFVSQISMICLLLMTTTLIFFPQDFVAQESEIFFLYLSKSFYIIETLIAAIVIYLCFRYKKYLPMLLTLLHFAFISWFELLAVPVKDPFEINSFTLFFAFLLSFIAFCLCLYHTAFIRKVLQREKDLNLRPHYFSFLFFLLLSALFLLIFSGHLRYSFFAWQIIGLCAFLLVGIPKTEKSIKDAFSVLIFQLVSSFSFILALLYLTHQETTLHLSHLTPDVGLVPFALLTLAILIRAGVMPFQKWIQKIDFKLPFSSLPIFGFILLFSSLFLLLKIAPFLGQNALGYIVAFIGLLSFLFSSILSLKEKGPQEYSHLILASLGALIFLISLASPTSFLSASFLLASLIVLAPLSSLAYSLYSSMLHSENTSSSKIQKTHLFLSFLLIFSLSSWYLLLLVSLMLKWDQLSFLLNVHILLSPLFLIILIFGVIVNFIAFMRPLLTVSLAYTQKPLTEPKNSTDKDFWSLELVCMSVLFFIFSLLLMSSPLVALRSFLPYAAKIFNSLATYTYEDSLLYYLIFIFTLLLSFFLSYFKKDSSLRNHETLSSLKACLAMDFLPYLSLSFLKKLAYFTTSILILMLIGVSFIWKV